MWNSGNNIELNLFKSKSFFLIRFECGLCSGLNEFIFFGFSIDFFQKFPNFEWGDNCGCPNCDKSNYHNIIIKSNKDNLIFEVESDNNYEFPVNVSKLSFSLDISDKSSFTMEKYLDLDFYENEINNDYYQNYKNSKEEILMILEDEHFNKNKVILKLIFSNIITLFETYLSDLFLLSIDNSEVLQRKLVEKHDIFSKTKIEKKNIFQQMETIKSELMERIRMISFHNMNKVIPLFKDTLEVDLKDKVQGLNELIVIRHHIVHRNGKDSEGQEIEISIDIIKDLVTKIDNIIEFVQSETNK